MPSWGTPMPVRNQSADFIRCLISRPNALVQLRAILCSCDQPQFLKASARLLQRSLGRDILAGPSFEKTRNVLNSQSPFRNATVCADLLPRTNVRIRFGRIKLGL